MLDEDTPRLPEQRRTLGQTHRRTAASSAGLRVKRCGPGEASVLDKTGREIAQLVKEIPVRRWRVAMAPALVRTPSPNDPMFDSQRAALAWLADV